MVFEIFESIGLIFKKKRKLQVFFIDESGTLTRKKKTINNNTFEDKRNGKPMTYVVDHNHMIYQEKTNMPVAFYSINNPQPINVTHHRNKELDAIGFKTILDSKAIADLFGNEGLQTLFWIMILVIGNLVLTGVVLASQLGLIKLATAASAGGG